MVDAIARTLKLDRYEWAHLSTLAGIATGPQPQQCAALPAAVRRVMHQVAPYPAAVLNDRFDLLAYNPEYRELIVDLDALPAIEHNLLWLAFTNPDWRAAMIDAEQSRCRLVGTFRSNMAKHLGEPGWQDLLTRLCAASPEFAERWERHEVAPMGQRLKVIDSPKVGLLRLESTSLWVNQGGRSGCSSTPRSTTSPQPSSPVSARRDVGRRGWQDPARREAYAEVDALADWSEWMTFDVARHGAPREPGVYLLREPLSQTIRYAGMAGERAGGGRPQGLRGRLAGYGAGSGAVSGFGEAALDRALADPAGWRHS